MVHSPLIIFTGEIYNVFDTISPSIYFIKEPWKPTTSWQREHPFLYSFVYRTVAPLPTSIGTTVKWPPPCKIYFVMKHKIIENGRTIMDFV